MGQGGTSAFGQAAKSGAVLYKGTTNEALSSNGMGGRVMCDAVDFG